MPKIAFMGGSEFPTKSILKGFNQDIVKTMYGNVLLYLKDKVIYLPRHGKNATIPSHRINTKANICALNLLGTEKIIGINSSASLKETMKPGTITIPDDYVDFSPQSFFELERKSIKPVISEKLRKEIISSGKKVRVITKNKAVYVQTKGPRFETVSEIRIIRKWGDLVGMTMATESTLSQELGIPYASICSVENYARGISKPLTDKTIDKHKQKMNDKITKIIKELIKNNKR